MQYGNNLPKSNFLMANAPFVFKKFPKDENYRQVLCKCDVFGNYRSEIWTNDGKKDMSLLSTTHYFPSDTVFLSKQWRRRRHEVMNTLTSVKLLPSNDLKMKKSFILRYPGK